MNVLKIIASHDLELIWDTCEHTILLSHQHIIADGPTKDILQNKSLLEDNGLELPLRLQTIPYSSKPLLILFPLHKK